MKIYHLILFITVIIYSCNKPNDFDCLKSTGAIRTEERVMLPFSKINLQDGIHLHFIEDSVQKVYVKGGNHLLPKISIEQNGDSISIENRNYCDWVRSFKEEIVVTIHGHKSYRLYNNGYGKVTGKIMGSNFRIKSWSSENMILEADVDTLWLESFKIGNTTLSGKIKNGLIFRHLTGRIDMSDVEVCQNLIYHDHGQGSSIIKATDNLDVQLFNSGNVKCITKPKALIYNKQSTGSLFFE